jgi:exosome complex RNA-binding protein Rrp4
MSNEEEIQIVTPGEIISDEPDEYLRGHGTFVENGYYKS